MIQNFLSNKWNLWGLYAISFLMMGFVFEVVSMTFAQMFLVFVLIQVCNFASYLYGMSKGVMFTTMKRPNFIKELDKLNEMIRKENDTTSKSKCGKCNRNDGTCGCRKKTKTKGCSSGGCKNC